MEKFLNVQLYKDAFQIEALWTSWIVLAKTLILCIMMGLLSYVHFRLQLKIESIVSKIGPEDAVPDGFSAQLKPYRVRRKRLATVSFLGIVLLNADVWFRNSFSLVQIISCLYGTDEDVHSFSALVLKIW